MTGRPGIMAADMLPSAEAFMTSPTTITASVPAAPPAAEHSS